MIEKTVDISGETATLPKRFDNELKTVEKRSNTINIGSRTVTPPKRFDSELKPMGNKPILVAKPQRFQNDLITSSKRSEKRSNTVNIGCETAALPK